MKNLLLAIIVLTAAAVGLFAALLAPDQTTNEPPPTANSRDEPVAGAPDAETTSDSTPLPQTMCNALGTPIPVVSNESALHDPAVVAKIRNKVPGEVVKSIVSEPPTELSEDLQQRIRGMVWVPGGVGIMGSDTGPADETPPHPVAIDGFWMDVTEVTNRQFQEFVNETGYKTEELTANRLKSLCQKRKRKNLGKQGPKSLS